MSIYVFVRSENSKTSRSNEVFIWKFAVGKCFEVWAHGRHDYITVSNDFSCTAWSILELDLFFRKLEFSVGGRSDVEIGEHKIGTCVAS